MGKPRHGKPDGFGQGGGYSFTTEPADDVEVATGVARFVNAYVMKAKRVWVLGKLLGRKRGDTLRGLMAVVDANCRTELEGNTGFPQHLQERFGDLRGVLISEFAACKATMAGAVHKAHLELTESCLFVAPHLALFIPEVGEPTLIRQPQVAT